MSASVSSATYHWTWKYYSWKTTYLHWPRCRPAQLSTWSKAIILHDQLVWSNHNITVHTHLSSQVNQISWLMKHISQLLLQLCISSNSSLGSCLQSCWRKIFLKTNIWLRKSEFVGSVGGSQVGGNNKRMTPTEPTLALLPSFTASSSV